MGRRSPVLAVLVVLAACAGIASAAAGAPSGTAVAEATKAARAAIEAAKKRDFAAAVRSLEEALDVARGEAPLAIRAAAFTQGRHVGLGVYDPVEAGVVDRRAAHLYVEVANFGFQEGTAGKRRVALEVAGAFAYDDVDEQGRPARVALGEKALGVQSFETRASERVTSFGVDVALSDKAPSGTYHLELKVKDQASGKTATHPLRFVLR